MKDPIPKRFLWIIRLFIGLLISILAYLGFVLFAQYRHLSYIQSLYGRRVQISSLRRRHVMTAADTALIESWMTFDYISSVFKVPPAFLAEKLNIKNQNFPRISLYKYAKSQGFDEGTFVTRVADVVRQYLIGSSTRAQ